MQEAIENKNIFANKNVKNQNGEYLSLQNNFQLDLKTILNQEELYKCSQRNCANLVCSQQSCQKPGLFCGVPKCPCQKPHSKCKNIMLDRIISSILDKKFLIPKQVKKSYEQLFAQINRMIQQLSQLRTKFQNQQEYFGISQEQIKFVKFIRDNTTEKITGKLVHSMSSSFQKNIQYDMISKDKISKDFEKKQKEFKKFCQEILLVYSKKDKKMIFSHLGKLFEDSQILIEQSDCILLQKWIREISRNNQNYMIQAQLIFRASQHQFNGKQFHRLCDGIEDTVVIAKNQYDYVIGGYAHPKWFRKNNPYASQFSPDQKNQSFLFSITSQIKINCSKPESSIRYLSGFGPIFGNGSDFYISDDCNVVRNSHFNPFSGYNIGTKYGDQNTTRTILSKDQKYAYFLIKQYQVYQIKNLL